MRWDRAAAAVSSLIILMTLSACGIVGGDDGPNATATPEKPGPEDAIGAWVQENRSLTYVGDCANADRGRDRSKLCTTQVGERGRLRAYALGPTFSDPTQLAIVVDGPDGWTIHSVENNSAAGNVGIIEWPMEPGDRVVVLGVGEGDCLSIRDQPSQQAQRSICVPDGTTAVIEEGPVDAEGFVWWRITGEGIAGWAAGTWLRLEEAVRDALNPQPTAEPEE